MNRGTTAEIDLNAISGNLSLIKSLSRNRPVIAVVKADAYGHGAVEVSRRLAREGLAMLAVAFTDEAKELRNAGIDVPILVLFDPDIDDIFSYNLTPVISDLKTAVSIARKAERVRQTVNVHIKVDTGMGRMGITGDAVREILEIAQLGGIHVDGVMSHFSEADLADSSFAQHQISKMKATQRHLSEKGLDVPFFHMANSAAVLTIPESHFDAVRPGLMLYGYSPLRQAEFKAYYPTELAPAMTVKTRLVSVKRVQSGTPISYGRTFTTKRSSVIGVLSVGYADGFSIRFSNNSEVIVRSRRVPIVGRVCMDLTMVDITDIEDVSEGDEVIIIGKQGNETIDAVELARKADTIAYEILTSLGNRAKRIYTK